MVRKIYAVCMALVFFYFSVVQLNDPDAIWWFTVYAIPFVAACHALFRQTSVRITFGLALCFFAGFLVSSYFVGDWQMENERYRETLGVLIASGCLFGLAILSRKPNSVASIQ